MNRLNRSNRFRLKLHNRPYSPFSSAGRFCKAVQVKSGLPAQWCCTSQRPGANNLMSVLRVEKPPPYWRRKSLSWWVKILNKLQCHVPWTTLSNLKTVQSVTRWIFAIGTCVISPVWERKSRIGHDQTPFVIVKLFCCIATQKPDVLQEGVCWASPSGENA